MRSLRHSVPYLLPFLALLAALLLLPGGPVAVAEDAPAPADPGMGEPGMGDEALPADDEELDVPTALNIKVEKAIEKGVQWLKQAQKPDGSWGLIQGNACSG